MLSIKRNSKQMNRIYINRRIAVIFLFLTGLIVGAKLLPQNWEIAYCGVSLVAIIWITFNGMCKNDKQAAAFLLALPILFSAFQNIYLGWAANELTSTELQILLSYNILIVIFGVCMSCMKFRCRGSYIPYILILFILLFDSAILYYLYPSDIVAFVSSLRNIISCICIYILAICVGEKTDIKTVFKVLNIICAIVILTGFMELWVGNSLWKSLNIDILWPLKGIKVNGNTGVPNNWYSSEKINGVPIRRMVSTFADPVNLGSYLFAMYMTAWYQNKKWFSVLIICACALTVSKGALLGFLFFIVIYAFFKDKTRIFSAIVFGTVLLTGIGFIQMTQRYSSGSTMFHIRQFFSSFQILKSNLFGMGVGNAGVLAGLVYGLENISIGETGIGVIIAQLGIIGLGAYIIFIFLLARVPFKYCYTGDFREKVFYCTLLFSFVANAMFNEVALSINSCAVYFLMLGKLTLVMREKYSNDIRQKDMLQGGKPDDHIYTYSTSCT